MAYKSKISVGNQKNVDELFRSLAEIELLKSTTIKVVDDDTEFYKIFYQDKEGGKCPFSLWIEKGGGEHIFLNIGVPEKEATVYHYADITSEIVVQDVIEFILLFSRSAVVETNIFCNGKLKRINYAVSGEGKMVEFSFLNASYFICLKKKVVEVKYSRWLTG
ncbi:hypothetical protein ACFSQD_12720 [Flavihumibacter stibioxidans]|uniref:Uncharacterized protein n=1 Tax=Flavihumibacter stibioxidans TaxID=1834163 RepID=A0ABR7MAL1_9BACT|nr:hypothetical protein [Flavihumibacter stibioxidans]MBC6491544.1 hypothetical protein [Flavihumibacter stibioxidans]